MNQPHSTITGVLQRLSLLAVVLCLCVSASAARLQSQRLVRKSPVRAVASSCQYRDSDEGHEPAAIRLDQTQDSEQPGSAEAGSSCGAAATQADAILAPQFSAVLIYSDVVDRIPAGRLFFPNRQRPPPVSTL